jgi:hypothetical protein
VSNKVDCGEFWKIEAGLFTVCNEDDDTKVNDKFYEEEGETQDGVDRKDQDEQNKSVETDELAGEIFTQEEVKEMQGDNTPPPPSSRAVRD